MTTNTTTTDTPGQRRKPGRPRIRTEPRRVIGVSLPVALIEQMDAATHNRTAFIEEALRALLTQASASAPSPE